MLDIKASTRYAKKYAHTLTLDDDVAALLERVRKRQSASLKTVINMALREGLRQMNKPEEPQAFSHEDRTPRTQPPAEPGQHPGGPGGGRR